MAFVFFGRLPKTSGFDPCGKLLYHFGIRLALRLKTRKPARPPNFRGK
ncbi:hypothetical protein [Methylococcus geothermalis]|uniref:Uncharacterized protein n=1 Tax=Methylococcus geothermalis TaxID=2681310 RepID=A0A858Q9F5_9GAMM|nr:hypothetical protein [Methylococcus geothermalis]QJD30411.1 hypothetical protein GNH96_10795 [Methylococcus geothermalis]